MAVMNPNTGYDMNSYMYNTACDKLAEESGQWEDHIALVVVANMLKRDIEVVTTTARQSGHLFHRICYVPVDGSEHNPLKPLHLGRIERKTYISLQKNGMYILFLRCF